MNVGATIKELRKQKGLSQAELATLANTTQASLSQIEAGRRPATDTLTKISAALKVPEPLIHILAMEKTDVPKENKDLYEQLFPLIKTMVNSLVTVQGQTK